MKRMKQVQYMFVFLYKSPKTKMATLTFGCPRQLMTFDFSSTKETGNIPLQQQPLGHKHQLCEFSVYLLLVGRLY